MGILDSDKRKLQKEDGNSVVAIDIEEIVNNINIPLKNLGRLNKALTQMSQYKRVRAKVGRLWSGIMKQEPFQKYNELAALLACDALMRKNGYKMIPTFSHYRLPVHDELKLSADLYCFYADMYTTAPSADGLVFLQEAFRMVKPEKPVVDVWGFRKEYPVVVECIERYCDTKNNINFS